LTQSTLGNNINTVSENAIVIQTHGSSKNPGQNHEAHDAIRESQTCIVGTTLAVALAGIALIYVALFNVALKTSP